MAVQITQLFAPIALTGSAATIYTAPTGASTVVTRQRVRLANTAAGSISVTIYAIQAGGSAGAANCCCNAEAIAPNTHLDLDIPVLGPGGFVQAFASAAASVTMSSLDGVVFS